MDDEGIEVTDMGLDEETGPDCMDRTMGVRTMEVGTRFSVHPEVRFSFSLLLTHSIKRYIYTLSFGCVTLC